MMPSKKNKRKNDPDDQASTNISGNTNNGNANNSNDQQQQQQQQRQPRRNRANAHHLPNRTRSRSQSPKRVGTAPVSSRRSPQGQGQSEAASLQRAHTTSHAAATKTNRRRSPPRNPNQRTATTQAPMFNLKSNPHIMRPTQGGLLDDDDDDDDADPFELSTAMAATVNRGISHRPPAAAVASEEEDNSTEHASESQMTESQATESELDDEFDDEGLRFHTGRQAYSTAASRLQHQSSGGSADDGNTNNNGNLGSTMFSDMMGHRDRRLSSVDQSVNLMGGGEFVVQDDSHGDDPDAAAGGGILGMPSMRRLSSALLMMGTSSRGLGSSSHRGSSGVGGIGSGSNRGSPTNSNGGSNRGFASRRRSTLHLNQAPVSPKRPSNERRGSLLDLSYWTGSNHSSHSSHAQHSFNKSVMTVDLGFESSQNSRRGTFMAHQLKDPLWMKCVSGCQSLVKLLRKIIPFLVVAIIVVCCVFVFSDIYQDRPILGSTDNSNEDDSNLRGELSGTSPVPESNVAAAAPSTSEDAKVKATMKNLRKAIVKQGLSSRRDLDNPNSKPAMALEWLEHYDGSKLFKSEEEPSIELLLERFAVATFYFETHAGATPEHAAPTSAVETERERRLQRKKWMQPTSICMWQGISCGKAGRVQSFNSGQGLAGRLPRELAALDQLVEMDLSHNSFHSSIPEIWGDRLTNLRFLLLHDNALTGTLPNSLSKMTALYDVDISSNQLEGSIPAVFMNKLTSMRLFMADQNRFTGTIPGSISSMEHLEYLDLSENRLGGELPEEIFEMKHMVDLRLENNQLKGTISSELGAIQRLEFCKLGSNEISGTIPDVFDDLRYLVEFDLQNNRLEGPLPPSLGLLTRLSALNLHGNKLSGEVPDEVCSLKEDHVLKVLVTDCHEEIVCECCDMCY